MTRIVRVSQELGVHIIIVGIEYVIDPHTEFAAAFQLKVVGKIEHCELVDRPATKGDTIVERVVARTAIDAVGAPSTTPSAGAQHNRSP